MNREVEFRGKPVDVEFYGEWVYGFYLQDLSQGKIKHFIFNCPEYIEVIPETVGQYIDLKDEEKKKIFEGDIVKIIDKTTRKEPFICTVDWLSNVASFEAKVVNENFFLGLHNPMNEKDWIDEIRPFINFNRTIEVIGNVFDNPELLQN